MKSTLGETVQLEIQRIYAQQEERLVEGICKELAKSTSKSVSPAVWRTQKLNQMGSIYANLKNEVYKGTAARTKQIVDAVQAELKACYDEDTRMYLEAKDEGYMPTLLKPAGAYDREIYNNAIRMIEANVRDSVNLTNTKALDAAKNAWLGAVNSAYVDLMTGQTSVFQAVRKACLDLGGSGLPVTYSTKNGKLYKTTLDVAVRRNIVTSMAQATGKMTEARCGEFGTNLVEVSAHSESRPEHEVWQGKVYCLVGRSDKYPNLVDATGYGSVDGLCGINCRHYFWPYFEGFSEKNPGTGLSSEENERIYNEAQTQRGYERKIRTEKRQIAAARASGYKDDAKIYSAKHKATMTEYQAWLDKTGRPRYPAREVALYRNGVPSTITPKGKSGIPESWSKSKSVSSLDITTQALKTNPQYGKTGYDNNCAYCVSTYELRRRGYNVIAKPNGKDYDHYQYKQVFHNQKWDISKDNDLDFIKQKMSKWGEGARAQIVLQWADGSGLHEIIAEQKNGRTLLVDPQIGLDDCEIYLQNVRLGTTMISRVDNLNLKISSRVFCKRI